MEKYTTIADVWEALDASPRGANIWLWTGQGWKGPMSIRDIEDLIDREGSVILTFKKDKPTEPWVE